MADEKYEVDYEAILAGLVKTIENNTDTPNEYFELLNCVNELSGGKNEHLLSTVACNMINMSMVDQVLMLRAHKNLLIVCEFLQKKYNFPTPELAEDEDPDIY